MTHVVTHQSVLFTVGTPSTAIIINKLPTTGSLHQFTDKGPGTRITAKDTLISDNLNRLFYVSRIGTNKEVDWSFKTADRVPAPTTSGK
jgi:hypothetical protein